MNQEQAYETQELQFFQEPSGQDVLWSSIEGSGRVHDRK